MHGGAEGASRDSTSMPAPLFWLAYAVRSLRRSGSRGAFAVLCVVVGVAGVVALQTATLTIQNALTSNVRAANGGDISVATQGAPISTADLTVFKQWRKEGRITAWTAVSSLHATAVGTDRRLVPFDVNVVTSPPYPLGGQPTFVAPTNGNVSRLLRGHGDVLLSSVLADELGMHVGSRLFVNGIGGPGLTATVRGILAESSFEHAATMTVDVRDAAALGSGRPQYSAVYVNARGGINFLARRLRVLFPAATIQTVPEALNSAQLQVHDFRQFMLLVGLLALLIAGVGILNAMQSMLAQRRLEIAMLKAMGFGRGTLYALFGLEALLIGLIGGVLGTVLGAVLSKEIATTLAAAMAIQVTFILDAGTLVAGVGLGIGAALVFAVLPIVRAAAIRPLEILREGEGVPLTGWLRTLGLVALLVALFAALASVTLGDTVLALQFVLGAVVVCALLTGLFAAAASAVGRLGPARSRPLGVAVLAMLAAASVLAAVRVPSIAAILVLLTLLWAATVVLPRQALLPLIIAARSIGRRRTRSAVTLVAFLAGVLSMALTLTVALSLQRQIDASLQSAGSTNLIGITNPAGEHRLVAATRRLAGVKDRRVSVEVQTEPTAINGRPLARVVGPAPVASGDEGDNDLGRMLGGITGYDLQAGQGPTNAEVVVGRRLGPADAGSRNVLVRSDLEGYPYRLQLGDRLTFREAGTGKTATVTIVGFYARAHVARAFSSFFTLPVYADSALAVSLGGADAQAMVGLTVDPNDLAQDATSLQRAAPGSLVIDVGDLTAIVEKILNELLQLLGVITALVLGAGVAVVANGVGLAMLERRREIAVFKAIGFGPSRVQGFVLLENALIGTLSGAVAVLITAIALALLSHYALRQAIGFDPVVAVLVLVLATLLAVATAYLTARRPVRIRPIEALRNE